MNLASHVKMEETYSPIMDYNMILLSDQSMNIFSSDNDALTLNTIISLENVDIVDIKESPSHTGVEEMKSKTVEIDELEENFFLPETINPNVNRHSTYNLNDKSDDSTVLKDCPDVAYTLVETANCDTDAPNNTSMENSVCKKYVCNDCEKSFNDENVLMIHKLTHKGLHKNSNNEALFFCDKCTYRTIDSSFLTKHQLGHQIKQENSKLSQKIQEISKQMIHCCDKCNIRCRTISDLEEHKLTHEIKLYICDQCTYVCHKSSYMKRHKIRHSNERNFSCQKCDKVFKSKNHLTQHENTHNSTFQCNLCDEKFPLLQELRVHSASHSDSQNYLLCDCCGFMTSDAGAFEKHKPCLGEDSKYECSCGLRFKHSFRLKEHIQKVHLHETILSCDRCDYITVNMNNLMTHMTSHDLVNDSDMKTKYTCDQCDYTTFVLTYLKKHMHKHTEERPFQCQKCNTSFKTKSTLVQHISTHRQYKCSVCQQIFESLTQLKRHFFTHKGIKSTFTCDECGFLSSTSSEMDAHKNFHREMKKYVCDECGLRFKYPIYLKRHQRQHSRSKVLYSCNKCSFVTTRMIAFKKHMENIHRENVIEFLDKEESDTSDSKIYKCNLCDYTTNRMANLKVHRETHIPLEDRPKVKCEEEKYFCNQCAYNSNKLVNLRHHLRSHTVEKPFSCDKCTFTCKLFKYLKQHQLTHMAVKPHLCDLCSRSFRKLRDLRAHAVIHTLDSAHECDLCDYICMNLHALKKHKKIAHKPVERVNVTEESDSIYFYELINSTYNG